MSDTIPTPADDGFDRHYAEKIWALVPEAYRSLDGEADRPGPLRALVEILAEQAAIARRSVDRLWSDSRIDEADDWAVPYIGALVGARPVNALNRGAQRANVGRTIHYRRRLGTVRLAELLADDIADWDAVASEAFRRLIRHWHMLDGGPVAGAISRTPQWGYAELRPVRVDGLADRAHDDLSHYPDFRRHRGLLGRYNIPKVNLHLFRQYAFPLTEVIPVEIAPQLYTLDPSGRDVGLFQVGGGAESPDQAAIDDALLRLGGRGDDECRAKREWEMRAPIPCRRLNFAGFRPLIAHAPVGIEDELAPIYGRRFATERGMLEAADAALAEDPAPPNALSDAQSAWLIARAMEAASPRRNLFPGGDPATLSIAIAAGVPNAPALGPEEMYGANLEAWGEDLQPAGWVEALVDPSRGRLRLMDALAADEAVRVDLIHYGAFWPVGAGTHDRASGLAGAGFAPVAGLQPDWTAPLSGEHRFVDNRTYRPQIPASGIIEADGDLVLSAANQTRPYVVLEPAAGDTVTLRSTVPGARLVVDGLWLAVIAGAAGPTTLRIDGTWAQVILRNVTIDPGGERAAAPGQAPAPISAVRLAFSGAVDDLVIERCVTGRIVEVGTPLDPCATDTVRISDSIVRSATGDPAISLRNASLTIDATTVFGNVVVGRIDASELLADGRVLVEDQQAGCFRFSAAAAGSRTPHPYESHFFDGGMPFGTFVSRRFGDAGYAQLSEIAPFEIREGGEDGVEIGAFKAALDPIKRADLTAKLLEFMPINVIVQQIIET